MRTGEHNEVQHNEVLLLSSLLFICVEELNDYVLRIKEHTKTIFRTI